MGKPVRRRRSPAHNGPRLWPRQACGPVLVLMLMLVAGCVGSSRTDTDYREKAANTAEAVRSSIETARLVVGAAGRGKSPGAYTSRTLSQLESAVGSVATQFGSVQPPTRDAARLREEITALLDRCRGVLGELRISARQGRLADLPRLAEPLPRLSARLRRFQELVVT
ncbi:hypothetical protein ACFPM3_15900 [Streptomyces coeruleoprunus]|uniref:Lipoprotein n=1 Tax=Streptomyces coeruleoprunus TaxID=285563 RepID=A0ABV9XF94_9ACTN